MFRSIFFRIILKSFEVNIGDILKLPRSEAVTFKLSIFGYTSNPEVQELEMNMNFLLCFNSSSVALNCSANSHIDSFLECLEETCYELTYKLTEHNKGQFVKNKFMTNSEIIIDTIPLNNMTATLCWKQAVILVVVHDNKMVILQLPSLPSVKEIECNMTILYVRLLHMSN